jgi:hypothetical protein
MDLSTLDQQVADGTAQNRTAQNGTMQNDTTQKRYAAKLASATWNLRIDFLVVQLEITQALDAA